MREPVIRTYATRSGPMLALAGDQYVTRALDLYGEYAPDEWRMLRQLIRPGMTVVEIGANMGSHSVDMARACAPGPFYAFEPQQLLFQILCGNLAMNNVTNAVAFPDACGADEGEAIIPAIDYAAGGNFGGVSLQSQGSRDHPPMPSHDLHRERPRSEPAGRDHGDRGSRLLPVLASSEPVLAR